MIGPARPDRRSSLRGSRMISAQCDRRSWGARVAHNPIARDPTKTPAMEMPALWKPQNGFHSALEISPRTRDSHIPTADRSLLVSQEKDETKRKTVRHASRHARAAA